MLNRFVTSKRHKQTSDTISWFESNKLLTFVDVNDVGVLNGGHDLDLPSNPDQVGLRLDLALLDRFDRDL